MLFDIGRVCTKIAGREAGKLVVIVEKIDENFVLIDGNVRRKKCNVKHLEPMQTVLKIGKNASTNEVKNAMQDAGIEIVTKKIKRTKKIKNGKTK